MSDPIATFRTAPRPWSCFVVVVCALAAGRTAAQEPAQPPAPDGDDGWQELETRFVKGVPFVKLSINEATPEWFYFNVSLERTGLDAEYAQVLQLPPGEIAQPDGTLKAEAGYVKAAVRASGRVLEAGALFASPIKQSPGWSGDFVPKGIVSAQLLIGLAVRIDLQAQSIKVKDSAAYRAAGHIVPIMPWRSTVLIPTVVEGLDGQHVGAFARLSMGYSRSPVAVHPEWLRRVFAGPPDAVRDDTLGLMRTLRIGDIELSEVPIHVDSGALGNLPDADIALWSDVLERFVVTIDFSHQRLVLEPRPDWRRPLRHEPAPARPERATEPTPWQLLESEFAGESVLVRATLGQSEPMWFVLDTGSPISMLDNTIASRLGIAEGWGQRGGEASLPPPLGPPAPRPIAFGEYQFTPRELRVASLRGLLRALTGRDADGILGTDMLERFAVRIDYVEHTVQCCPAHRFAYGGTCEAIPIKGATRPLLAALVKMDVGEITGVPILLDTGSTSGLDLSVELAASIDARLAARPRSPLGLTFLGPVSSSNFRASSLVLGSRELQGVPGAVSEFPREMGLQRRGLLGSEILSRFTLIVDAARQRIILEPNTYFNDPFPHRRFGFAPEPVLTDPADPDTFIGLLVKTLDPEGAAALAGLRAGDILVAIDGEPLRRSSWERALRRAASGTGSVSFRIKREGAFLDVTVTPREDENTPP